MPQLMSPTDDRETVKIVLPASSAPNDEAYVVIYKQILVGDVAVFSNADPASDPKAKIGMTVEFLAGIIKEWNFTDKAGKPVPVTKENVAMLPAEDIFEITRNVHAFENLAKLSNAKKKP